MHQLKVSAILFVAALSLLSATVDGRTTGVDLLPQEQRRLFRRQTVPPSASATGIPGQGEDKDSKDLPPIVLPTSSPAPEAPEDKSASAQPIITTPTPTSTSTISILPVTSRLPLARRSLFRRQTVPPSASATGIPGQGEDKDSKDLPPIVLPTSTPAPEDKSASAQPIITIPTPTSTSTISILPVTSRLPLARRSLFRRQR